MKRKLTLAAVALALLTVAACSDGGGSDSGADSARRREETSTGHAFDRMTQSQQVPAFDFSQERQTLIDVLTIRAEGTHGTALATSFSGDLLWWCPSLGAPVPSTYQLTNPVQIETPGPRERGTVTVAQGEPTGIYSGDSAATYVLCLDDNGTPFARYEEANVGWVSGVVEGLPDERRARVDEITFEFTTEGD